MDIVHQLAILLQISIIDLSLAADNAIVIGIAAAGLEAKQRHRAVVIGLGGAVVIRIVLACFAVRLLDIAGLTLAGGLLLLWVTWKMYQQIRHAKKMRDSAAAGKETPIPTAPPGSKKLTEAITQILLADLAMSLDNILAVAGAADDHYVLLAFGLILSVALVGAAATTTAKFFHRFPWIGWIGIATVLYVAVSMMADGVLDIHEVVTGTRPF